MTYRLSNGTEQSRLARVSFRVGAAGAVAEIIPEEEGSELLPSELSPTEWNPTEWNPTELSPSTQPVLETVPLLPEEDSALTSVLPTPPLETEAIAAPLLPAIAPLPMPIMESMPEAPELSPLPPASESAMALPASAEIDFPQLEANAPAQPESIAPSLPETTDVLPAATDLPEVTTPTANPANELPPAVTVTTDSEQTENAVLSGLLDELNDDIGEAVPAPLSFAALLGDDIPNINQGDFEILRPNKFDDSFMRWSTNRVAAKQCKTEAKAEETSQPNSSQQTASLSPVIAEAADLLIEPEPKALAEVLPGEAETLPRLNRPKSKGTCD